MIEQWPIPDPENRMNAPVLGSVGSSTSASAVVSLIFGILSWLGLTIIGAIIAIVCGHIARSDIRRAPAGSIQGDDMALTGLILGYLNLAVCVLMLAALLTLFGGFAWLVAHMH